MTGRRTGSKRLGRPPAPPGEARHHRVVTFVNDGEFELLNRLSKERDTPLSTTVYQLLRRSLAGVPGNPRKHDKRSKPCPR